MSAQPPQAVIHLPGEATTVSALGSTIVILATAEDTGGAYSLTDFRLPAQFIDQAPPVHVHTREDEAFHVLEGLVTIQVGDRTLKAGPGSFVLSPRGEAHKFSNPEAAPARLQIIASPGGLERFFEELYYLLKTPPPDIPKLMALFRKYGMSVVGAQ